MNFVLKGVVAVSLLRVVNSNERRHGILMTEKKGTKWLVFAAFWVGGSNATYPESVWDYVIYSLWHWSLNYPHIYHENDSFSCNMNRKMRGKLIRGLRASYSAACISLRTYPHYLTFCKWVYLSDVHHHLCFGSWEQTPI